MIEYHPPNSYLINLGVTWALKPLKVPPNNSNIQPILRTSDPKKVGSKV